ncbi:MAG: sugar ABC transporter permease [Firmicutes bacterium]|nr:sugar ABC transporter permease [Bacillota bacterium]
MGQKRGFWHEFKKNKALFLMLLPGFIVLLLNNYLPMFGVIIAFKNFKFVGDTFIESLLKSEWVGFKNFKFLFNTADAYAITRNTLLYNLAFIVIGLVVAVGLAVALSEMRFPRLARIYQGAMFLPYFLSWVVASYLVYAFLGFDTGFINKTILARLGLPPVSWYNDPRPWPFILVFMHLWKWAGYNCVVYLAAILSIDPEYYEAAIIDGASKWQQITNITIPQLVPLMTVLTLLNIGRIFYADFGLFFHIPRNTGILYPVTNVIDTYVYNTLLYMGDIGMSSAAGLYQAVVGFTLVIITNTVIRKTNRDYALF